MAEHHYIYGSGMYGCLYDNGPHIADTKVQAIAALLETFSDLDESELDAMAKHLASSCYHKFGNSKVKAGADYCEIAWQPGPAPEDSNGS